MSIMLVYVTGPYSAPSRDGVEVNIDTAVQVGLDVAKMGACPVIVGRVWRQFTARPAPSDRSNAL